MSALKRRLRRQVVRSYRFAAARPGARKLNEFLFDLASHGLGIQNYENDVVSGERTFLEHVLPAYLHDRSAPVVVDVGAHDGGYAEMVLNRYPEATTVCVEPHPLTYESLEQRLAGRATLLNCALGAEPGTLTLFDRSDVVGSQHASLYEGVISELHGQAPVTNEVAVRTLDEVFIELGLDHIDLLKIDTEGHERQVLAGAEKILGEGAVNVVQLEFNEMNIYSRTFLRDLRELLCHHRPYRLLPHGLIEVSDSPLRSELFGFQNVVFLPRR